MTLLFKVDLSEIRLFVGRVSLDEPTGYYAALVHRVDGPAASPDPILKVLIKGGTCRHTPRPYDMKSTIKELEMELQFAVDDMIVEAESRARGPIEQKRHEEKLDRIRDDEMFRNLMALDSDGVDD